MLVIKFISRCRKRKPFNGPKLSLLLETVPKILVQISCLQPPSIKNGFNQPATNLSSTSEMQNLGSMQEEDFYIRLAATYLLRTATMEVKHFNKEDYLEKIRFEHNGILYSKNRILEGMEFQNVSGTDMVNLDPLGANTKFPIIDRYSPLAYSLFQYIHYDLSKHSGMETCHRLALERIFVIQGFSVLRELAAECIKCKIKRRKFLEMSMEPISNHQLNIVPPFYACQVDIFGPLTVYAPGASKDLRGRPAKACKVSRISRF